MLSCGLGTFGVKFSSFKYQDMVAEGEISGKIFHDTIFQS